MSNFDAKIFGENIKKYRNEKGLSQQNLADLINKSRATICRFENGSYYLMLKKSM